jgi:hypothetical protein
MNQTLLPGTWQLLIASVITEGANNSDPSRVPDIDPATTSIIEISRNNKNNNQTNQDQENINLVEPI